ncbi:MAG: ADP-ribosylglycohydrolase family protein, partial [Planctomycetota bacterium]
MDRRLFGKNLIAYSMLPACFAGAHFAKPAFGTCAQEEPNAEDSTDGSPMPLEGFELDAARGLLLGGLIGDALGGPIEFLEPRPQQTGLTDARSWAADKALDLKLLQELAANVPLLEYKTLRPETAAYGPWVKSAPAGTLTDDSRHKIILLRAIATAEQEKVPLNAMHLAQAFLDFSPIMPADKQEALALEELVEEGLQEYRFAARWLLGERDLAKARPIERIWAGVNNCSGQMLLPPLALA